MLGVGSEGHATGSRPAHVLHNVDALTEALFGCRGEHRDYVCVYDHLRKGLCGIGIGSSTLVRKVPGSSPVSGGHFPGVPVT